MSYKTLDSITISDIESHGIPSEIAAEIHQILTKIIHDYGPSSPKTWHSITQQLLNPQLPFSFHQSMYYGCYKDFGPDPPAWLPTMESARLTNIGRLLERRGKEFLGSKYEDPMSSFSDFQNFSVSNPEVYWKCILEEMGVSFSKPPQCILNENSSYPGGKWLPGCFLNPAEICLSVNAKRNLDSMAVLWRNEGEDHMPVNKMTLQELRRETVTSAAEQTSKVIQDAKPIASSTVETISNSDPALLVEGGAALFLAYLLLPRVLSAVSFSLRGYKGGLSPAQTLDMMCTQNYFLIDIRSEKDKNKSGIPQLPPSAKNRMIAIPLEELPNKIRSLVKSSKKVEAEIVALKISYLKRLSKSSNIVIMDTYSDSAKTVAKTLTSLGFKNSWIMADGFSGGRGWLQSRLGTESYNMSFSEIFSPSRIIPGGSGRFGTTSSTVQVGRKMLPGSN